jgi:carotenoid cleavage oxygenase
MSTVDHEPNVAALNNPYLAGNFAPVEAETTAFDLSVEGQVPEELEGRLLRIGPNPITAPDASMHHWFVGTGLVHGLRLRGGRAEWYRSRYVGSARVSATLGRAELPGPGRGTRDRGANTNLMSTGGRLFAIADAGSHPVELSYELDSVTRSDFDGTLTESFSAHPRRDPATGEHHVLTYQPGRPTLHYLVVDKAGRARSVAEVLMPHGPLVHDVAITATSVVVLDLPTTFQLNGTVMFPYAWNPEQAPRIGLLPRSGDVASMQWFDAPSCFVFHIMNAYDEGSRVIVDVVRHPRMFDKDKRGPNEGRPILARWLLDRATGRLSEAILDDHGSEFPRINGARSGVAYRYGYTAHWAENLTFGPAMKHDLTAGRTEIHHYGPGRVTLEPVFVRRQGSVDEDDGWILSYVYDAERNKSDVVILDARNFEGPPVATIRLPVRVPFGFHGGWAPDRQTAHKADRNR